MRKLLTLLFSRKAKGDPIKYLTDRLHLQYAKTEKAKEYAYNVERIASFYVSKWSPEDYLKMQNEISALIEK